jgi:hypothetical protein
MDICGNVVEFFGNSSMNADVYKSSGLRYGWKIYSNTLILHRVNKYQCVRGQFRDGRSNCPLGLTLSKVTCLGNQNLIYSVNFTSRIAGRAFNKSLTKSGYRDQWT